MTREDAIRTWRQLLENKQDNLTLRYALTGDGSDAETADVAGRTGWAWVRYDEEPHKVSQVRNWQFPGIAQDVPVVIGKLFPTDRYVQILGINRTLYEQFMTDDALNAYLVPPHGASHHGVYGSDPAYMDLRNLLPGRVRPTDPLGLSVYVEPFAYGYANTRGYFPGGGLDLTYDVPTTAGYHRYVLITFDTETQTLERVIGADTVTTISPTPPDVPMFHVPLAVVQLPYAETEIDEGYIFDYRILFPQTGLVKVYQNLIQYIELQDELWEKHQSGEI